MRYLMPAVMCYDEAAGEWLIGEQAMLFSEKSRTVLIKNLLNGMIYGQTCAVGEKEYACAELASIFFGQLIKLIQIKSGIMNIAGIMVTMRKVNRQIRELMEDVFARLGIAKEKVRLQSYAVSCAEFLSREDENLWKDGALLFDFESDGFFAYRISPKNVQGRKLITVDEKNYSLDFAIRDLASELLRGDLDAKLSEIYENIRFTGASCSVYFTGTGFTELWFEKTLELISGSCRVFKGNNLYVKGACLSAYERGSEGAPLIVAKGRTRASISIICKLNGELREVQLSPAAASWFDADGSMDFIMEEGKSAQFIVTSLESHSRTKLEFDLGAFPDRPVKATRVGVSVSYINDAECEIKVRDKGFGGFFEASGREVVKRLNLEGYI